MFGIIIERDARNAIESRFLSHIARISDDTLGMRGEIAEVEISLRSHQRDAGMVVCNALMGLESKNCLQSFASQRSDYLDTSLTSLSIDDSQKNIDFLLVSKQHLTIEGQHQIFSFLQMKFIHDGRTHDFLIEETNVVDEHVAHHIHLGEFSTLLVGDTIIGDTCREENIRQTIDD